MKKLMFTILATTLSLTISAETISSNNKLAINPAAIDKVIRLVDKTSDYSQKRLQVVVKDSSMSTDVSPRYTVYLGYVNYAEMANFSINFQITDQAIDFLSATRKAPGIYEVKTKEYREDGMYTVTRQINATQVFIDEELAKKSCGEFDFCDQELNSTVEITETAVLQK
ncbi:MAG: hypothetical protein A2504_08415 [Bdellovibrionales bacterium RIFOXYD12_FULL_39_22]|nr:MAG: hypothetical protein A2385_01640 [Bdellovibrionales bacterium RIFOXYB1_FULL_39_21]OFZ42852.1 MAG: hypothetical protein A2485_10730 [Bdellovibrionales bacterium RIFOXYC12_FULL_39_17]OFZ47488.1 MAG: hypothetical protein A2404_14560 [Bdellovibrionales bacterium RIFOXYC1_FULL_39_130]OFZ75576.1 MAG: hypothetical protein A2560_14710 [Bdellovibrionales bacterium RIFOXYD1_FULL_39_84]OFZ93899.1 MAG: hypothetical protein A2504_08415 [Bdellovibrionales bacterium RIFOXYD12_FULL_39_22]HLE10095.1 hy